MGIGNGGKYALAGAFEPSLVADSFACSVTCGGAGSGVRSPSVSKIDGEACATDVGHQIHAQAQAPPEGGR
eukprot:COSAG05_NODE_3537_length_2004_cov_4.482168_1_plen_70_part_10